jgi:hypothetical protein
VLPNSPWGQLRITKEDKRMCLENNDDEDPFQAFSWGREWAHEGAAIQLCPGFLDWVSQPLTMTDLILLLSYSSWKARKVSPIS